MLVAMLVLSSLVSRPPQVHSALETLSKCEDLRAETCLFAAAWLKMGGDAAMPEVLKAAPGMTQTGQFLTISAIGTMPSKAATDCLGKLAQDARLDSMARSMALEQLAKRPDDPKQKKPKINPIDVAMTLLEEPDPNVRQGAVRIVVDRLKPKDEKLIEVILAKTGDPDGGVRSEAMLGLGFCDCARAPANLFVGLKDSDPRVRRAAIESLALVKHPPSVPLLVELLNPYDNVLNKLVARALRFQSGEAFGDDPQEWRRWLADRR